MHLFVNCKLVDSVWTENFQKINEFYEQNEIKTISKSEPVLLLARENMNEISLLIKLIIFNLVFFFLLVFSNISFFPNNPLFFFLKKIF
jgi:hypothetical protein